MTIASSPIPLIAMNGFKGSLSNKEACEAVRLGLAPLRGLVFPMADGGRGTLHCIRNVLGGELFDRPTTGPLGAPITATALALPSLSQPDRIVFESAQACGYDLTSERRPLEASSFGLGKWIRDVLGEVATPATQVLVGLGDSAISDAGMGMLQGLGFRFEDSEGKELAGNGGNLSHVARVHRCEVPPQKFTVLCDVNNPLTGPKGSAHVFGPQKGASPDQVERLDQGMQKLASLLGAEPQTPRCGSAGGLAYGFLAGVNATLVPGAPYLLDWLGFESYLSKSDFLVTGEGKTDAQTLAGKAPSICIERAARLQKKSLLISGALGEGWESLDQNANLVGALACGRQPTAFDALQRTASEWVSSPGALEALS